MAARRAAIVARCRDPARRVWASLGLVASMAIWLATAAVARCQSASSMYEAPGLERAQSHLASESDPDEVLPQLYRLPPIEMAAGSAAACNRPETLNEAWACAEAVDPELQATRLIVSARSECIQAAQSLRSPNVSLASSYSVRSDEQSVRTPPQPPSFAPGTFPFAQDEGAMVGGVISIPVYTGGHITSSVKAAQYGEAAAEQGVQTAEMDLKLLIATTFVAVLEAQQMVQTAQTSLQSLDEHLKNAEQFYGKDVAPFSDVLDARRAAADARQRCLRAENELLLAKAEYNQRLGRLTTDQVWLQEPQIKYVAFELQSMIDSALAKRSELAQMNTEAEVLRQKANAIEAMNRPQVYMGGTYRFEENRFRTPEGIGAVGVAALWNIYDGRHATYEGASLLYEAAAMERRRSALAREIELEIHRTWLKRAEVARLIEETANHVRLAEENASNVKQRYQVGMATNAEVLAAEATRVQSLERLHRARYEAILAEMKMRKAAGIL